MWIHIYKFSIFFSKEFGAVLVNLRSGAIESEFHEYVRPTNHPHLSNYCVNLTRISQQLIDRQQRFPVVYQKFINWLNEMRTTKQLRFATPNNRSANHANTTFCSWTNWDLGTFFLWDCTRHGIRRPDYLRAWVDGKKIFMVIFLAETKNMPNIYQSNYWIIFLFQKKHSNKCTFDQALEVMNIGRSGTAHSAIDDAKTLSTLIIRLYRGGVRISEATTYHHFAWKRFISSLKQYSTL